MIRQAHNWNARYGKKVSVVVPVYNEKEGIEKFLAQLLPALKSTGLPYEVIVINDYSTDGTSEILKNYNGKEGIRVYGKQGKKGKAFSLIEGFQKAAGDSIVMIDSDLQYPPEAIPGMIGLLSGSDIVIANRKTYRASILRKILSTGFRLVFGQLFFGLSGDIQSGLKVFRRGVIDTVRFSPMSGWTFDLEFLYRSSEAGYVISGFDIEFRPRQQGKSKVGFFRTAVELGLAAFLTRLKQMSPQHIPGESKTSMLGAGIGYRKKRYITHTTLSHKHSAITTLTLSQELLIVNAILILGFGLLLNPFFIIGVTVAVLSIIYFADVLFNLYLILKSLHAPQEIVVSEEELTKIDETKLPVYSILCPLYREAHVVPQFLKAIENISWPKNKLDVLLLLEQDDEETIQEVEKLNLASYVRTVIVPPSIPKTKPKACNYGLLKAKGEYLVVYDAEDIPDRLQLKKAYFAFQNTSRDVICLQAKLNYYNPHNNLLTRLFTAEYSLWFDMVLTGLQAMNTSIPLGGTSNHFRTVDLKKLEGWDPFNVTEDADLGVRLFKKGFKTAIIDSTTLEEANSRIKNWIRQRSRWIKGYMQTYLVHMREAFNFTREKGIHSLIFQLTVGGKIAFILINPFLWIATISYFVLYGYVGTTIERFYSSVIFYMAAFSLVTGNFLFIYYYMIGAAKRNQWALVKYIFLVPLYWIMISFAGFIALYQLIFKPHYWEKTVHGFHLNKKSEDILPQPIINSEESQNGFWIPFPFRGKVVTIISRDRRLLTGMLLVASNIVANFLNFLFNAYLGRVVDLDEFALINLVNGFMSLTSIVYGAFGTTVNYRGGFLIGKHEDDRQAYAFWKYFRRRSFLFSMLLTVIWFSLIPFLAAYFKTGEIFLFILFGIVLLIRFASSADKGLMSARLMFASMAAVAIFEPVLKLGIAIVGLRLHLEHLAYASIPLATVGSFVLGWILVVKYKPSKLNSVASQETKYFPKKFFLVSLLSGLSMMTFLSMDVVLAKHFLSSEDAGRYALVSLVGKMIYFLGGLSSQFVTPLVSRNEGGEKSSEKTLYLILAGTSALCFAGVLSFGIFGNFSIPLLYGKKAYSVTPYLVTFTVAMMWFTLSKVFSVYYLSKKIYTLSISGFALSLLQFALIYIHHDSINAIVEVMALIGWLNFACMGLLHLNIERVKVTENNISDFFGLFTGRNEKKFEARTGLRILIFNWRDTKHTFAGGAEVYINELAKRWVEKGNSVTLFCGNDGKNPREETIDGIRIIRRGGFYFVYVWAFLYYVFQFRGKYDVVIDCENGIPFFTPLYAKENLFLVIYHVHQEVFRKSLAKPFAVLAEFLEMKAMPVVYRNTQIITISESSKQEILEHKLTRIEPIIIHSGIDLKKFKASRKSHTPLILYLGRLQYYKSLNVFIRAAKRVLEKIPEARFVIAGEGEKKQDLIKFSEMLGLAQYISFLGKVTEEEKIRLYQKAWVFVNPSMIEGWGITTIEANACGTPVVASNVPGLRDSIKNPSTGFLVPYGDSDAFARKICTLIEDEKLRKSFSEYAVQWAKKFDWEKSADTSLNFIHDSIKVTI